jgi:tetratricopeptide (TPR) repeat protein
MATAVSNLLGVSTTPRGTYQAEQITQPELHWGIRRTLELIARDRPLAIVFEDLHWAEPTLIELIEYLADTDAEMPLLIVATGRPEAVEVAPGLLREGARSGVMRLEALSDAAGTALLRELLGSDELATAPQAATVLRAAGGNPLFLEETVLALQEAGLVDEHGWHLPPGTEELPTATSLQALIGSRLDQLPRPEKRIAQHASVVGSVFWPGSVAHVQGDAGKQADELVQHIEGLEQRDLVRAHEVSSVAGEREYGFKHILIRDVAYGQLPKGRRIELHMRFAEWMQALPTEEFIEIVAWHLERSCRLAGEVARSPVEPPVSEAVAALMRAAEKAERREGMREAERYYARALEIVDDGHEATFELRVRQAKTLQVLGRVQEALELLLPLAEEPGLADRPELRCEVLLTLGLVDQRQGRASEAAERMAEASALAEQQPDRALQIRAAFVLASLQGDIGAADEAIEGLTDALTVAHELDDRALLVQGHLRMGFLLFNKGELAAAEEQLERCLELAHELGSSRDEARASFPLALIKHLRGHSDEAERLGEQAKAMFERTGDTYLQIQNLIAIAQYALARGDTTLAEERLREALPLALEEGNWLAVDVYRVLTETLVQQKRLDDARELVSFAAEGIPEEHLWARASVLLAQATVAAAHGEAASASAEYDEALGLLEGLDVPIDLCQARLAYAKALRVAGDFEAARAQLEPAREVCERIGAIGMLAQVERELVLVGSEAVAGLAPETI